MEVNRNNNLAAAVSVLIEHAREIITGSFKNVDRIFRLTDKETYSPEIAELAETFAMMSVKVEAREWDGDWRCWDLEQDPKELFDLTRSGCPELVELAEKTFGRLPGPSRD